jgi:hypothetical protein
MRDSSQQQGRLLVRLEPRNSGGGPQVRAIISATAVKRRVGDEGRS